MEKKKLSEMSLEELWQLFPIILVEYQEPWKLWYSDEEKRLSAFLPQQAVLSHIGSTAVVGIWAKPIVDILVEIPNELSMFEVRENLESNGYIFMCENEGRMSFNRGYTKDGFAEKVYHLHLRFIGDNDEIYFRDYLNEHPEIAKEYETLKLSLWKKYEHDRDAYTNAKSEFVVKYTEKAKQAKH